MVLLLVLAVATHLSVQNASTQKSERGEMQ
jgi:hypothetical protein